MGTATYEQRTEQSLPAVYKGPRGLMLVAIKRAGSLTARELGEQLGLSSNAIRHHLKELESEGVVGYRREQRGVGAPTFAWYLSASGESLFPQRYREVLTEVLDRVAEQSGRQAVVSALETRFSDLSVRLGGQLADAPPERRMEVVQQALVEGGYMAEWHEEETGLRLTEHNCAVRALAERFPEICEAEAKFLQDVLRAAVQREAHMLEGCTSCEYRVQFVEPSPAPLTVLRGSARPDSEEHA
jgi:DeoR family suf operon transcriptional repressor